MLTNLKAAGREIKQDNDDSSVDLDEVIAANKAGVAIRIQESVLMKQKTVK